MKDHTLATKIGFTFPHLPKRWNYNKNAIELLCWQHCFFFYVTMLPINIGCSRVDMFKTLGDIYKKNRT
jgi:hypothetical protein